MALSYFMAVSPQALLASAWVTFEFSVPAVIALCEHIGVPSAYHSSPETEQEVPLKVEKNLKGFS